MSAKNLEKMKDDFATSEAAQTKASSIKQKSDGGSSSNEVSKNKAVISDITDFKFSNRREMYSHSKSLK